MSQALTRAALALALLGAAAAGCEREAPRADDSAREIPREELADVYAGLASRDGEAVARATARILEAEDLRFTAALIEGLRMAHLAGESAGHNDRVVALERLSGERFGSDWFRWLEWYAGTELAPPPGFLGFKSELLARIDPELGAFLAEGMPVRIRPELVRWGGVLPGSIPALTNPKLAEGAGADEAFFDAEPVFGVAHGGEARAYPIRILDWHEIVNDRLGGEALTIASCALCGAATAYLARGEDGATHAFETSGLLDRSNKLMFDTKTRTLWSQLGGEPVLGPLAAEPLRLAAVPGVVTSWRDWRERHPETTVLSLDTGHERDYAPGRPYGSYLASEKLLFPASHDDDRLAAKTRVYGVAIGGAAKAWSLGALLAADVVNDEVGGEPLVLVARGEPVPIEGQVPGVGRLRYVSGAPVRAYRRSDGTLRAGDAPDLLLDAEGGRWRVAEDALYGPGGARAPRVPGTLAYWFAWRSFHPETEVSR